MFRQVDPNTLDQEGHWDPHIYCGPGAMVALAAGPRTTLPELGAVCVEGLRRDEPVMGESGEPGPYDGPTYRQVNLGRIRFRLDAAHWDPPTIQGPWCVEPGDIILNKLARAGGLGHPADFPSPSRCQLHPY